MTRNSFSVCCSAHVKESKTVLDSRFHAMDSGFQVLDFGFFVSGAWIPDSNHRLDSKGKNLLDSGIQETLHGVILGDRPSVLMELCCKLYQSSNTCSYRCCHQTESKIETMAQKIKESINYGTNIKVDMAGQTFRRFIGTDTWIFEN